MKIAITGHTSGIGKSLYDFFKTDHNVLGFSRSNGYDITVSENIDKILNETLDCDVFINVAYDKTGQIMLSEKWFEKNKDKGYLLVNVSSIITIAKDYLDEKFIYEKYCQHKQELEKISWDINFSNHLSKSIVIAPGIVDTKMAHPMLAEKFRNASMMISVDDVRDVTVKLIDDYFTKNWFVPFVYIFNKGNLFNDA